MGWGYGTLSSGKEAGYTVDAVCEHPGCDKSIHRGLAYACGGDHGEDEVSCDGYFCDGHLTGWARQPWGTGRDVRVCAKCEASFRKHYPDIAKAMDEE